MRMMQKVFGAIPRHVNVLGLFLETLSNADDSKKVFGAIPTHVRRLGLITFPNADNTKGFFWCYS